MNMNFNRLGSPCPGLNRWGLDRSSRRISGRQFSGRQFLAASLALLCAGSSLAVRAENPLVGIGKEPLDRAGRYLGVGWSDGYHACEGSGARPCDDLPPISSRAIRRRNRIKSITFYDRFDESNVIHPRDYQVIQPCDSPECDQSPTMAWETVSTGEIGISNEGHSVMVSAAESEPGHGEPGYGEPGYGETESIFVPPAPMHPMLVTPAPFDDVDEDGLDGGNLETDEDALPSSSDLGTASTEPEPEPFDLEFVTDEPEEATDDLVTDTVRSPQRLPAATPAPARVAIRTRSPRRMPRVGQPPSRIAYRIATEADPANPAITGEQTAERVAELQISPEPGTEVQANPFIR